MNIFVKDRQKKKVSILKDCLLFAFENNINFKFEHGNIFYFEYPRKEIDFNVSNFRSDILILGELDLEKKILKVKAEILQSLAKRMN